MKRNLELCTGTGLQRILWGGREPKFSKFKMLEVEKHVHDPEKVKYNAGARLDSIFIGRREALILNQCKK